MNPLSQPPLVSESLSTPRRNPSLRAMSTKTALCRLASLAVLLVLISLTLPAARAQMSSGITGIISDASGAVVPGAVINVKNTETGALRTATTNESGRYFVLDLPIGEYRMSFSSQGFSDTTRYVKLIVNQEARIDVTLQIGGAAVEELVSADAPMVSTSTTDISGLVSQQAIKNLPLNGRSYDLLLTLNPGIVNFTSQKTGGTGISNSTTANNFAVSGNRPQQNLFLLNGIEYTGAAENNMQPGGASGLLLGVDAVREFNVQRDNYGAEFGKHPGGQIIIATQSGSNDFHGSAYEFLRNNALDASNFFDQGSAPPFQRNQFGVSAGGPIQREKTFIFGNYEGFRQNLHQTSAAFVPDAASRASAVASVQPFLNLWPIAPAGSPDFNGIAEVFSSPLQTIREDFGTLRVDHIFSQKDSLAAVYTIDDGADFTATPANPYSANTLTLREQVFSLEETHIFSPALLNTARIGYSRAGYFFSGEPTPGTPAATVPGFLNGLRSAPQSSAAAPPPTRKPASASPAATTAAISASRATFTPTKIASRSRTAAINSVSAHGSSNFSPTKISRSANSARPPSPASHNSSAAPSAPSSSIPHLLRSTGARSSPHSTPKTSSASAATSPSLSASATNTPRLERSPRPCRQLHLHQRHHQHHASRRRQFFTTNNATFLPQPRIGLAWSPASPSSATPSFAPASACSTIFRTRSAIAPIKTRRSIPFTASRQLPVAISHQSRRANPAKR